MVRRRSAHQIPSYAARWVADSGARAPGQASSVACSYCPTCNYRPGRLGLLIVWCTVDATALAALAICFAVVSIRRADRIAREAREANVRERRNVFELGVLSKLIEICGLSPLGAGNVLAGLLRVLPDQDLPGIRAESAQGRVPYNEALKPFMPSISRRLIGA